MEGQLGLEQQFSGLLMFKLQSTCWMFSKHHHNNSEFSLRTRFVVIQRRSSDILIKKMHTGKHLGPLNLLLFKKAAHSIFNWLTAVKSNSKTWTGVINHDWNNITEREINIPILLTKLLKVSVTIFDRQTLITPLCRCSALIQHQRLYLMFSSDDQRVAASLNIRRTAHAFTPHLIIHFQPDRPFNPEVQLKLQTFSLFLF